MIRNIHQIVVPNFLKVDQGSLSYIGAFLEAYQLKKVVIFFGNGLTKLFGQKVFNSLEAHQIELIYYEELDTIEIEEITRQAFNLSNQTSAIVGIGGGKVIDAAKYMGFLRKIPFISIPTSSSSDGFSSSSASLIVDGRRTSVPARLAYGIIVDLDIIESAPTKFIYSGIGDLISKITALYDWVYEAQKGVSQIDDFALMIAKKAVNSFVRTPFESIHDKVFLKELVDSLAMSGIANEMAGNSAPSSGSEHLISHALDKILETPQLHGIQVGIATYLMSRVQNHRYLRVHQVLTDTGFWDYVKTLNMRKEDFKKAIELAPSIKPSRLTYIHDYNYQKQAIALLDEDSVLRKILI